MQDTSRDGQSCPSYKGQNQIQDPNDYATTRKLENQSQRTHTISHHRSQEEQPLIWMSQNDYQMALDSYSPEKAQHLTPFQLYELTLQ